MTARPPADEHAEVRAQVLAAALPNVPFDGWTLTTLRQAAEAAGIAREAQRAAFPLGVIDLVTYWSDACDAEMVRRLAAQDLPAMKVRARIATAVRTRLETMAGDRIAARKALSLFALPFHAAAGLTCLAHTVDAMWRAAGDTSSDFNWYTKRALLAGVYSATLTTWLSDTSPDAADTEAFLAARIDNVMQIEKLKSRAGQFAKTLPDPFRLLGRLRYPR